MGKSLNLIGEHYGEWEVLEKAPRPIGSASTSQFWLCKCSCGNTKIISGNVLRQGKSKSCGCKTKELQLKALSEDLTGQRFGNLQVISRAEKPAYAVSAGAYWLCKCDCGNTKIIMGKSLRSGKTISCGCHYGQCNDLTGKRFGKLVAIRKNPETRNWLCKCDCGNEIEVYSQYLQKGQVKSCGCLGSYGEYIIESLLKENDIQYLKEYSFADLVSDKNSPLRFDFAIIDDNKNIIRLIEFQGEQHYETSHSKFFDSSVIKHDQLKQTYCLTHKIPLVLIPYWKRNTLTIKDLLLNDYLLTNEVSK